MGRVEVLRQESGKNWRVANVKELYSAMTPAPEFRQSSSDPKFYTREITFPQTVLPSGENASSTLLPNGTVIRFLNWGGGDLFGGSVLPPDNYVGYFGEAPLLVREAQ